MEAVSAAASSLDVAAAVALAGLELDEPLVHRLQDGRVRLLHHVLQLVGVRRQVVHFYKRLRTQKKNRRPVSHLLSHDVWQQRVNHSHAQYLCVCKLAVLQVGCAVEGPDAGVGVVEGVFTHAVWETLLRKKGVIIIILKD